jgi:hypothetical protein
MHPVSTIFVARLVSLIAGIGIFINAAEVIVEHRAILGFFSWDILRTRYFMLVRHAVLGKLVDSVFSARVLCTLLVLQALAALAVPVFFMTPVLAFACAVIVLSVHLAVHLRLIYGFDGSDQMQTVLWFAITTSCIGDEFLRSVSLLFVAAQFVLSYITSGVAKALSPIWRGGEAVSLILRTSAYGSLRFAGIAQKLKVSRGLSWATIALETLGP